MPETEARDLRPMSPTQTSSRLQKPLARRLKEELRVRKIHIPYTRSLGSPGLSLASADGIATTSHPVQRPCEPAGTGSPRGLPVTQSAELRASRSAMLLEWLNKIRESGSPPRDGSPSFVTTLRKSQPWTSSW